MPDVTFPLGNRRYTLRCAAGQEDNLRQMAGALDARLQPLANAAPGADDRQLLVMAALGMIDELREAATRDAPAAPHSERESGGSVLPDNSGLAAENAALQAELSALREWAEDVGNRLVAAADSLSTLAESPVDD